MSIFSPDVISSLPDLVIESAPIASPAARLELDSASPEALARGERFADSIEEGHYSDFEKAGDLMAHVSTFLLARGKVYMTYYANTESSEEDPSRQTARLVWCDVDDPDHKTFLDVQSVGDECSGKRVELVYDTILARRDEDTLLVLWTAKVGGVYYRLWRPFDLNTETLGEVGVNRFRTGDTENDFSTSGIISALSANGIGHKTMYSDIGIMQKFTTRRENGVDYVWTGAYSGDHNMIIKSRDYITWEYVASPDFPNESKWENALWVEGDRCFYFVRQHDPTGYGFLTVYNIDTDTWDAPVLVADSQSRGDFFTHSGELFLLHAPIDREHVGVIRVDRENIAQSEIYLRAHMHSSCFYPFARDLGNTLAMSYTVQRKHIRLARFDSSIFEP